MTAGTTAPARREREIRYFVGMKVVSVALPDSMPDDKAAEMALALTGTLHERYVTDWQFILTIAQPVAAKERP